MYFLIWERALKQLINKTEVVKNEDIRTFFLWFKVNKKPCRTKKSCINKSSNSFKDSIATVARIHSPSISLLLYNSKESFVLFTFEEKPPSNRISTWNNNPVLFLFLLFCIFIHSDCQQTRVEVPKLQETQMNLLSCPPPEDTMNPSPIIGTQVVITKN